MSDTSSLLQNALVEYDEADNEVERLLDIIDQAAIDLEKARELKRTAKIRLDEAIASASRVPLSTSLAIEEVKDSSHSEYYSSEEDEISQSCSSSGSDNEEDDEDESDAVEPAASEEEEEDVQFDIADEALEQIRYRLGVAKIDPNSPQGASLLDELLIRLKHNDDTISNDLIDEIMDDLMNDNEGSNDDEESHYDLYITNGEGSYDEEEDSNFEDDDENCEEEDNYDEHPKQSRIQISRRGKVLGWYEGGLDDRGYAREGEGTMYYNAGHFCKGYWKDDEMVGRGVYKWSDGHIYHGEWLKGKRHGVGRFIRPDGVVLFGRYEEGRHVGQGVRLSADQKDAQLVEDGVPLRKIDMADAFKMKKELGFDGNLLP
eukprot:CAMPEP_0201729364 /NCGR_PEP_ID=MMETSP0593-20130828/18873_1 /ASSEMBLY_ACC=CAM_ASM_000672 /TAXON_ID=267983 /ORGANISM="Skeletonema japonicum, Strain CCMP2506" /LENGTH=373 /DNA_ID=CAMNT_0048221697 /DNA_START=41 /DNA_END=1162 /DNA_ORIENTATION=-